MAVHGVTPNKAYNKEEYQDRALLGVSRTFALTIPQLPEPLRKAVTNAYLLCRIADTIEDEPALQPEKKQYFHDLFTAVVGGEACAEEFSEQLYPLLSDSTIDAEKDLIKNTPAVIELTHALNKQQRAALSRCISIMCHGMPSFQHGTTLNGLRDQRELDRYCYYVAGVVGEMLTELFSDYSDEIAQHKKELMPMAVSFGQGLQMTNILKDVWEDRGRGVCWLPHEIFKDAGFDLGDLSSEEFHPGFGKGMKKLIGVAHAHLRCAMRYTMLIPSKEVGIRRFCLWAVGMAVLTLKSIYKNLEFTQGTEVKISRRAVKLVIASVNLTVRSNTMVSKLFDWASNGLPLEEIGAPEMAFNGSSADSLLDS